MMTMAVAVWVGALAGAEHMFRTFAAQLAGPAVAAALWQGAMVAFALAMCVRLLPRLSAADRFRIWAAGFAVLAALPFLPIFRALPFGAMPAAAFIAPAAGAAPQPWINLDARWSLAIAALWLAASAWRAFTLGVHSLRLRKLWTSAAPVETAALSDKLQAGLCMGHKRVQVCITSQLDRPSVIGFFAPRILIPDWLIGRLTPGELEQVILHEAEHLRRRDDWTNLLEKLCLILLPLNPALIWIERRLCREREMACDEAVVRRTQAARAYAACLASLAERRLEHKFERQAEALSLGAWRRRTELVDRVHRVLRLGPGLHPVAARSLVGIMGFGLLLGFVGFAHCPQFVAFVAPPEPEPTVADNEGDAVINPVPARMNSAFRSLNAVAKMPEAAVADGRVRGLATLAPEKKHEDDARKARGSEVARESAVRGVQPAEIVTTQMQTSTTQATGQQFVVLTTWEQVETIGANRAQDESEKHEASTDILSATGAAEAQAQMAPAPRQFAVTRLIFRVYPAGAVNAHPAVRSQVPKAGQGAPMDSTALPAPRQQVIPLRDGWLVIQL